MAKDSLADVTQRLKEKKASKKHKVVSSGDDEPDVLALVTCDIKIRT